MRSSTWRLEDLRNVILNLGFVGENLHTRQIFDCKKMFDQYPNASVSMTVTPPEGEPYPGTIERDGDLVIWDVRDCDLVAEGDGEIQIVFTQEPHIARSYNARTHVCRSQVPTGSIPSGLDDYITRADQLLDEVKDTFPAGGTTGQVLAKKSDTDYDTEWVDQGGGTEDYDELENRPQIGGVTLTGNKTLHDLGAASEADVEAKYTKPETGIPASDMAAGVIPDPEDLIDDEAGSGDTDKVWSADKSASEAQSLMTEITHGDAMTADAKSDIDQIAKDGYQKWFPEWERGEYNDTGKATNNNRMRSKNVIYLASGTYTIYTDVVCSVFAYMNENISDGSNLLWRQTGDKTFTVTTRHYIGIVVDWDADDENVPTGNYVIIPSAVSDVIAQATATEAKATENRTLIDERTGFVDGIYTAVLENVTLQDNKGIGSGVAVGSVLSLTNDNYSQVMTAPVQAGRKYRIKAKVYNNYYLAHFTDANNVLIQKYVKNTTGQNYVFVDEVVTAPAGATKLYIAAMKSPKILLDVFNPYTIKDIVDMKTDARGAFCIMQFNVGDWYEGQYRDEDRSGAIPANETIYANYMELFHGIFGRYKPDIAMLNEDAQEMCLNRHDDSRAFLGKYFRHLYRARMQSQDYTDVYNTISTSFDVFDVSTHYFTDTETNTTRNWIKGYTYLNGKKICLICTHLSPVWERGKANATELLNAVVEEDPEYLILCGDFNLLRNTAEVVAFETAGYVVSCGNTEYEGHTYGPGDFVITTSNINVKSVYCDTQKIEDPNVEYIDHLPTITYLEIF